MLEVRDLCKSYGGHPVLSPISFRLEPGTCLGVLGSNGSGKSTLLRLLSQAERPDGGEILFRGRSILGDRGFLRHHLGYVPQASELAEELTGAQQLQLWQAACGCPGPLPEDLVELLGLAPLLSRRISQLSGGMQRRISIAMALLNHPEVLIMDEVTAPLDEGFQAALLDWLGGFLRQGGCMVWCTHRQSEVEALCDHALFLEQGMVVQTW